MSVLLVINKTGDGRTWEANHNAAVRLPSLKGECIAPMLKYWAMYAQEHQDRFESLIGEDYVLGPAWRDAGLSMRRLLDGETGRLDCGTLDGFILDTLKENGFDTENL